MRGPAILTIGILAATLASFAHAREAGHSSYAQASPYYEEPVRPLRRARTRIEVTPLRPPRRECVSWLEREFRPSGTVIVPRLRCWWAR